MKKIFSVLFFVVGYSIHAQYYDVNTIVPNSPSTSKFEKVFTPKVSEFTGALDLSIPIVEITVDEIKVPILLRYDSGGIKVDEEASWVGQSWSILAGGMITRNQVGIPDEMDKNVGYVPTVYNGPNPLYGIIPGAPPYINTFCYTPQLYQGSGWFYSNQQIQNIANLVDAGTSPYSSSTHVGFVRGIDYGANDGAPDIFNIFLPNGGYEKFFFKNANEASFFDKSRTKVNYTLTSNDQGIESFEVKDEMGTHYEFNTVEYLRYQKNYYITNSKTPTSYNPNDDLYTTPINASTISPVYSFSQAFASFACSTFGDPETTQILDRLWPKAWHVNKIKSVKGKEVNFTYVTDTIYNLSKPLYRYSPYEVEGLKVQNNLQKIAYPRLVQISWDEGRVDFVATNAREDVYSNSSLGIVSNTKSLDKIVIYNKNNKKIKEINLSYSYKNAEGYSNSLPSHEKTIYKRMFLDQILIKDSQGDQVSDYSFNYNTTQLPNKFSPEVDYWGYYNNKTQNALFPSLWGYPDEQRDLIDMGLFSLHSRPSYTGQEHHNNDAIRTPDFNYVQAGILEKVTYPTGGELSIVYEQNQYLWRGQSVDGPGLRVKQTILKENPSDSNPITTDYIYSENGNTTGRIKTVPLFNGLGRYQSLSDPSPRYYVSSKPLNSFNISFNSDFGYVRVEKKYSGGAYGKEVKTFSFPVQLGDASFSDGSKLLYQTTANTVTGTIDYVASYPGYTTNTTDYYPYPPETNFSFATGKQLSNKIYDKDNNLLADNTYTYDYNDSYDITESYFSSIGRFTTIRYLSAEYQLIAENRKEHFGGSFIENNTSFKYNNDFFISEVYKTNSNGDIHKTEIKYPKDFTGNVRLSEMVTKNMLKYPIETINKNNGKVISSEINLFKKGHFGNYYPDRFQSLETTTPLTDYAPLTINSSGVVILDSRVRNKLTYTNYDEKGNLTAYRVENNNQTVIIWGYNKSYPIAKIENVRGYNDVPNISAIQTASNNDNDRTFGAAGNEGTLRSLLNNLRNALPTSLVTTYTYDPLIGATSITDPRGETIYYHYDEFNRLEYIKNAQGKIISKNIYNYKN